MPAEWEPQDSIWLAWPHDPVTWPGEGRLERVQATFERVIRAIGASERIDLLVDPGQEDHQVRRRLRGAGQVSFHSIRHADSWIRDYGPTFVVRDPPPGATRQGREIAAVNWIFDAWGGKYESLMADDAIGGLLAESLRIPRFEPGIVLEGGSIDVNGAGCVLTTEQCLLNPNRNPDLSKEAIEAMLRSYLGVTKVLWLGDGIEGDDTDGHVDDIARFANATTLLLAMEEDRDDPNHEPLAKNAERARSMTDANGQRFSIVEMPMPTRLDDADGRRLPASYLNFLITNRLVLMPTFGGPANPKDARALKILEKVFEGRQVMGVPGEDLVWGMGTIHCLSQQMPSGASPPPKIGAGSV
ncbi:MAG: agmatine deiminase family protein [Thermoplasmatota archaeon]